MSDSLTPLYEEISNLMSEKSDEDWEEIIQYQFNIYCSLCNKLNATISTDSSPFNNWNISDGFVIGIFEEREGGEMYDHLAKSSLGESKASELGVV